MTTPDLTPTLRAALDTVLEDDAYKALSASQRTELTVLRDACPKPMPIEDGLAVHVDSRGFRSVYYVRDGKVNRFLRPDGTLYYPQDPAIGSGTWEPLPGGDPMTTVHTQAELDKAIADQTDLIYIESPAEVNLFVYDSGSSRVVAIGSSRVEARGSSRVVARDDSRVEARGSSSVIAWGSSQVVARDDSRVEARGSSHVMAMGSSHVIAMGSSHVEAWDFSRVEARDTSSVVAGVHVIVHRYSKDAHINGGVVIDMTKDVPEVTR